MAAIAIIITIGAFSISHSINVTNEATKQQIKASETLMIEKMNNIQKDINDKFDKMGQRLDYQEKLNSMQIERDVNKALKENSKP